jgi:hypothetical protein
MANKWGCYPLLRTALHWQRLHFGHTTPHAIVSKANVAAPGIALPALQARYLEPVSHHAPQPHLLKVELLLDRAKWMLALEVNVGLDGLDQILQLPDWRIGR